MDINDLRRMLKASASTMADKAQAIEDLEASGTAEASAIEAAVGEFEAANEEFKGLQARVKRAETVEAAKASTAVSELDGGTGGGGGNLPAQPVNADHKGADTGLMVAALANSKGDKDKAATLLEEQGHSQIAATLSGATESAGGVLIPRPQSNVLIDLLKPKVVVRKLGAVVHDMPAGKLRHARVHRAHLARAADQARQFDAIRNDLQTMEGRDAPLSPLLRATAERLFNSR
jgi:HK97 family phage major capsid protein